MPVIEATLPEDQVRKLESPLDLLGHRLSSKLDDAINDRQVVEDRWLADFYQYNGEYCPEDRKLFEANPDRASVFLNITRPAVNQSVAQIHDLLFPTDDKNYGITPTPRPDIQQDLLSDEPAMSHEGLPITDAETGEPVKQSEMAARALHLAQERAKGMEREIEDQLRECFYARESRKALHHAAVFGTGILCGPEAYMQDDVRFNEGEAPAEVDVIVEQTLRPRARFVPIFDFYPDMSAATLDDAEYVFERSYMSKGQLLEWMEAPGVMTDTVVELFKTPPDQTRATSRGAIDSMRSLFTNSNQLDESRYEIWFYTGPIDSTALKQAGVKGIDPEDPLDYYNGTVVFSGDKLLKLSLNPLEIEALPYSVFNWQPDEFCIFGYGIPHTCRNEQRILNTAWRMMLDNSTKSMGPQVVVKRSALVPADGSDNYTLTPWKMWLADETVTDVRTAFQVFTFPSLQEEAANILQLARQFLDQTVGLPPEPGQGDGQAPNTLGGMAMLMNSANTDRRRQVRDWDDCITVPMIQRFFHWNMQFNDDPDIKGDHQIVARGTSALLMKEQQAINLMAILDKYAAHPALAEALKPDATLRKVLEAMHIQPDQVVKTEEELAAEMQAAQEQGPEPDVRQIIEQMRTEQVQYREDMRRDIAMFMQQSRTENAEAERQMKRDLALMNMQTVERQLQVEAMKVAQSSDVSYQKILADLKKHRQKIQMEMLKDREDRSENVAQFAKELRDGEDERREKRVQEQSSG